MKTYRDFLNTRVTAGYRGLLRDGEFHQQSEMRVEEPLQNGEYIMNRRNICLGDEPHTVDLSGFEVDPLLALHQTMHHNTAKWVYLDGKSSCYDGVSLVLPNAPKPITQIDGKDYFLVAGLYKNSCKINFEWNYAANELSYAATLSDIFLADMVSLGNPLYGLSPTGKRNYFFGLSEYPITPFEDKHKSIFSYGGVIAIGSTYHIDYKKTGVESKIKILSPSALKLIEKWRKETLSNDI